MGKKATRIPVRASREALTDSPFASALGNLRANLPDEPATPVQPQADIVEERPPWHVERTRKGGWPVSIERRGSKEVTVISRASGDLKALLKALQKTCGVGGTFRDKAVELQGNHVDTINEFLDGHRKRGPA